MVEIIKEEDYLKKILEERIYSNTKSIKKTSLLVSKIISNVAKKGDDALRKYTLHFDNFDIKTEGVEVSKVEIDEAYNNCNRELRVSLQKAARRINDYHRKQLPISFKYYDREKVFLGSKWDPLDSIGLYVPGGTAAYPSSVLMLGIPAKVAKVKKVLMCVPCPNGYLNQSVLAAAKIAKIDNIFKIGGAQAIAAMGLGTAKIPPVDKIFGPGNKWVTEAKRQLFGQVGIDMIAGPSEILVLADNKNNPKWIAADLLSQAEHDISSQSILVTDNKSFAKKVINSASEILKTLPRKDIAKKSWKNNGKIIIAKNLMNCADIINKIAPEHLQIAIDRPKSFSQKITNAGAIFIGRYTPEAIGDYIAGPNHVLPTSRSARYSSGLSTQDYMRRTSLIEVKRNSFSDIGQAAIKIAKSEGLDAHALSLELRNK